MRYVGVSKTKNGTWVARCGDHYFGTYKTIEEAIKARAVGEKKIGYVNDGNRDDNGKFIKGNKVNLGRVQGQETREKISKKVRANPTRHFLGKKFTEEHKEKLRLSHWSNDERREHVIKKMSASLTGVSHSTEKHRRALRKAHSGSRNVNWKGGVTPHNVMLRHSIEYKAWRKKVFERDGYTCQSCGARGVKIHADHIMPFAYFPELRFEINNGRTLCVPCHKDTDTYGNKAKVLYGN